MKKLLVGRFQGGIQALSRSYFTKIIPEERSGEYFGLIDICGKGASFVGTTIVSVISQITGNISIGVGMIAVLFCIGTVIFLKSVSMARNYNEAKSETSKTTGNACTNNSGNTENVDIIEVTAV